MTTTNEESGGGALVSLHQEAVARIHETVGSLKAIRTFIQQELKEGIDYGKIPGTGDKKALLLAGAQKVTMYFNARPRFDIRANELGEGHVEIVIVCDLIHRPTGQVVAQGLGSCSTMEGKYRFRNAQRVCPSCGKTAIIKGRDEYGGGWLCFKNKGGCGLKFPDGDPAIEKQPLGKVENENIHDTRNTVLKMAKKRAQVDAAMGLGCMSELFTQDLEELDTYDLDADDGFAPGEIPTEEPTKDDPKTDPKGDPKQPEPTPGPLPGPQSRAAKRPWLEVMKEQKDRVGATAYNGVLGIAGFKTAEEITDQGKRAEVYKALLAIPSPAQPQRVAS